MSGHRWSNNNNLILNEWPSLQLVLCLYYRSTNWLGLGQQSIQDDNLRKVIQPLGFQVNILNLFIFIWKSLINLDNFVCSHIFNSLAGLESEECITHRQTSIVIIVWCDGLHVKCIPYKLPLPHLFMIYYFILRCHYAYDLFRATSCLWMQIHRWLLHPILLFV